MMHALSAVTPDASARTEAACATLRALVEQNALALEPDQTLIASVPVAPTAADKLLTVDPTLDAVLWAPPSQAQYAGIAALDALTGEGPDRFKRILTQGTRALSRLRVVAPAGSVAPSPRLLGGFSFQIGRAKSSLWDAFGEARFVLPRLAYSSDRHGAWLSLALSASEAADRSGSGAYLALAEKALATLAEPFERPPAPAPRLVHLEQHSETQWARCIAAIRDGLASGRFEKVVAAHRMVLELDPAPDAVTLLSRLRSEIGACTRFAFRRDGATFVGATPERLLDKSGLSVETEAMAGSSRAGGRAGELLASRKDLDEHNFVVRELVRALGRYSDGVEYAQSPEVHPLRYVLHLRTPIRAELRAPMHILELIEALHPTPAVGGVPTAAALDWIAQHEPDERGWYAGPIGWFDACGDGQFCVALRSGLLEGPRAHLYVGAGIVRDSDASSEYAETRLKLAAMLSALQVTL